MRPRAGVTSPYLEKPPRRIEEVLRDRGLNPEDVGLSRQRAARNRAGREARRDDRPVTRPSPPTRSRRTYREGIAVTVGLAGGAVLAVILLLAIALTDRNAGPVGQPDIASEETIRQLNEIAPAAGPSQE